MEEGEASDPTIQDFEDYSILLADYSMPFGNGTVSPIHESLTQSQYAKVVFRDIADSYPTDADVSCHYSLTSGIEIQEGDFVGVFRVGWNDINEALLKHPAFSPAENSVPEVGGIKAGQVLFRADALPKDDQEFYQLCYVAADGSVCGASVPFQFRRPAAEELCAVDGESEMVVVRSRTAVAEERVRKVVQEKEETQREKSKLATELQETIQQLKMANIENEELKQKLKSLENKNLELQKLVENSRQHEHQYNKLQQKMQACSEGKIQTSAQLRHSQQHIEMLNETVETLSSDKARMVGLLRECVMLKDGMAEELEETQAKLKLVQKELTRVKEEHAENELALETKHKLHIAELRRAEAEVETDLLRQLKEAKAEVQDAIRQKRDLGLLREHRTNLEYQLEVLDEKYKTAQADWRARELDLVGRIGLVNQELGQLKQQQAQQAARQKQQGQSSNVQECDQCEAAGVQLSLLEAQVKDLQQRLSEGADAYRKVYVDKCKVEKKLARASVKQTSPSKSVKKEPVAVHTMPSTSRSAQSSVESGSKDGAHNCPMCGVTFPPGASDLFTQHFDNHLS